MYLAAPLLRHPQAERRLFKRLMIVVTKNKWIVNLIVEIQTCLADLFRLKQM